ncbi:hypothetical protein [Hydrogenophaga sp. RWCD_12]|uniref:hypothetical protein n=1 Tax=Hydrogenophaga sp. RWCD_12 TaxID=3391190 RepID=UPI00398541CB
MIRPKTTIGLHLKFAAMLLMVALCCPQSASSADKLVRAERYVEKGVYETTFIRQKQTGDSDARATFVTLDGVEHTVVFPDASAGVSLEHVEINDGTGTTQGNPFVRWVYTKGELRVRATVRYGWFDGFESYDDNQPILEIFVNPDFTLKLPRFEHNKAGWVDEFTVVNEDKVLKSLFSPKTLRLIRTKKLLFAERDSDLVLDAINFGNECGIRYKARAKSSAPRANATVASRNNGWQIHC